jgi:hypothetical protein
LEGLPVPHETEPFPERLVNVNMKVSVGKVDGRSPVSLPYRVAYRGWSLHAERVLPQKHIEGGQVEDWSPPARGLGDDEKTAVKARREVIEHTLYCFLPKK